MEDKTKSFFSFRQAFRFYHTVRYLKVKQIFYRIFYPVKKIFYVEGKIPQRQLSAAIQHRKIQFVQLQRKKQLYSAEANAFEFLNWSKSFGPVIEWTFKDYGALWSFHLHYFDWLPDLDKEKALGVIIQYIDYKDKDSFFNHSYVASIRIVNWIRFCVQHEIKEEKIYASIYRQAHRLAAFPEYELMGNHLMENGIALVWAGLFFNDDKFQCRGEQILLEQFREQILADGAHFEKSVSYHSILLKRLLELTQYYRCFYPENSFYKELISISSRMLSYLFVLIGSNDFLPLFGDSNEEMTISIADLQSLAQNLPLVACNLFLKESGVRKLEREKFSLFFNMGNIPAFYQPGHTHADAFSFCLNAKGKPVISDRGVSTYERNAQRQEERSTAAHNTVVLEGSNSLDTWASFRIGKRLESKCLIDSGEIIDCEHDGYFYRYKVIHRRTISCTNEKIIIEDRLIGWKGQKVMIFFHLYPGIQAEQNGGSWKIKNENIVIEIEGAGTFIEDYQYAKGFNATLPAKRISGIAHKDTIRTTIIFK